MTYFICKNVVVKKVETKVINVDVFVEGYDRAFTINIYKSEIKHLTNARSPKTLGAWFNSDIGKEWLKLNRLKKIA